MSSRLLTNASQNTTGTEIIEISQNRNLHLSQVRSIYSWGTLGANAIIHIDAQPFENGPWISAARIDADSFQTVIAAQIRGYALRGRVAGGDGTTDVNLYLI